MKNVLAALILALFCSSAVQAEDVKVLPSSNAGDVTFTHKKHQERLKGCTTCHKDAQGGKIENLSKKADAHQLCVSCHETKKAGPTKCGQCHKKKR
jgi:predicted CXXCH cytochrome family protein